MGQQRPQRLKIREGPVSTDGEHMVLTHGSIDGDQFPVVARVSPPHNGVITLEFVVDLETTQGMVIAEAVRREARWLFIDKGERDPWGYATYHCSTAANLYSSVHWGWIPDPEKAPRT